MGYFDRVKNDEPQQDGGFDAGGGGFEVIPENTEVDAAITDGKWVKDKTDLTSRREVIRLRWDIQNGPFEKRVVFQNLHLESEDVAKAEKAIRFFIAIDERGGGKMRRINVRPTDEHIKSCLLGIKASIRLGVWKDDATKEPKGNWVQALLPKKAANPPPRYPNGPPKSATQVKALPAAPVALYDFDEDIPM